MRTTDEARQILTDYATSHGVTVSALLEAIARRLPGPGKTSRHHAEILEEARAIDAERRRRG